MKLSIALLAALVLTGCATQVPPWQQDLNNWNRQWQEGPAPAVVPTPAPIQRPDYRSIKGSKQCRIT